MYFTDLKQEDFDKMCTSLNYYLYNRGKHELGRSGFSELTKGDDIGTQLGNIKIMSCLNDSKDPNKTITNLTSQLNKTPKEVIQFLKNSPHIAAQKKNLENLKKLTSQQDKDMKQMDRHINKNSQDISQDESTIKKLQKNIEKLKKDNEQLENEKKQLNKIQKKEIQKTEQENIKIAQQDTDFNQNLNNYRDIGKKFNKLSLHIEKIYNFRDSGDLKHNSLDPEKKCVSECKVEDHKCVCKDDNGDNIACDPRSCAQEDVCSQQSN